MSRALPCDQAAFLLRTCLALDAASYAPGTGVKRRGLSPLEREPGRDYGVCLGPRPSAGGHVVVVRNADGSAAGAVAYPDLAALSADWEPDA